MTLLFENDGLENLIRKYHLRIYFGVGDYHYLNFEGDGPSSYIGGYSRYHKKAYLFDNIHLKHDKIISDKNKRYYYTELEPFEKQLNELIIQRKKILADMKERKMKKDFK